jgi:aryl sulfotransferase
LVPDSDSAFHYALSMHEPERIYTSPTQDSGRWIGFPFRDGDIVISTRTKSGTTWMQMICALLIFRDPELPAPLGELSPWLDWLVMPKDEVYATLESQSHRRFIKTHTPLDGLPLDDRVTYIVVARHPLDAALSSFHQGNNIDLVRLVELTGATAEQDHGPRSADAAEALTGWISWDGSIEDNLDSLRGVFWHLGDAWRRRNDPNVVLVHYEDLLADLPGEMTRIAERLGIHMPASEIRRLSEAATFDAMLARSEELAPDPVGVLVDRRKFFRRGRSGGGREILDGATLAAYESRARELAPPDLLDWLHRGG